MPLLRSLMQMDAEKVEWLWHDPIVEKKKSMCTSCFGKMHFFSIEYLYNNLLPIIWHILYMILCSLVTWYNFLPLNSLLNAVCPVVLQGNFIINGKQFLYITYCTLRALNINWLSWMLLFCFLSMLIASFSLLMFTIDKRYSYLELSSVLSGNCLHSVLKIELSSRQV